VIAGAAWSLVLAARVAWDPRLVRYTAGVVALLAAGALVGIMQLASGAAPREGLHLVYGAIALGILPLARSFAGGRPRRDAALMAAAYLVLAVVLYRLFTTG